VCAHSRRATYGLTAVAIIPVVAAFAIVVPVVVAARIVVETIFVAAAHQIII
jgi:hypothetical protein